MKAVILAAGKSTRTEPLTLTRPKPLLKFAGKEFIKHTITNFKGIVDEIIIIVGYKMNMFSELLGNEYEGIKISYIEQKEQLGTGHAVNLVNFLEEDFILIGGDDLFDKQDFEKLGKEPLGILGQKVNNPENFGVLEKNSAGFLYRIIEKPKEFVGDLINCGCYKLTPEIFMYLKQIKKSPRGEYEFVDALSLLSKNKKISIVETNNWMPITYAWNLLDVNQKLLSEIKRDLKGSVEDNVTLIGEVIIGKGTVLKSGTYIEGPVIIGDNCKVGPNCYIRASTSIGDNCHIGQGVELKNSIIGDKSNVPHLNYVGDSVIGNNCNLGAGTIVANLRHDNQNIKSVVKGELIDSGRRKLGTIIGDGVHTGINTSILPGRKFFPNTSTRPGQVVNKDVME